eukprot:14382.XXX_246271_246384_1 [CDS] Oithona nana genome sequencing.
MPIKHVCFVFLSKPLWRVHLCNSKNNSPKHSKVITKL